MTVIPRANWLTAHRTSRAPDRLFAWLTRLAALAVVLLLVAIGIQLIAQSMLTWQTFGVADFITGTTWDPVAAVYGALPFIVGTILSSLLALLFAAPIGLLTAIFLAELAPVRLATPLIFMIELLAAIPSVVFGLWGVFVLAPFLRDTVESWIADTLRLDPVPRRSDLRDRPLLGRRDPRDHDPADDRLDLARGHP